MGSKKAEVVVEAIHCFLEEMNQVIESAKTMRRELQKYYSILKENIDPELCPIDMDFADAQQMYPSPISERFGPTPRKNRQGSGFQLPIPSNMEQELHEIQSTMESNAELQEQLGPATTMMADEEIKEIAAAMLPEIRRHGTNLSEKSDNMTKKKGKKKLHDVPPKSQETRKESAHRLGLPMIVKLKFLARKKREQRIYSELDGESTPRTCENTNESKDYPSDQEKESATLAEDELSHIPFRALANLKLAARRWKKRVDEKKRQELEELKKKPEFAALPIMTLVKLKRFARKQIENRNIVQDELSEDEIKFTQKPVEQFKPTLDEEEAKEVIGRNTRVYSQRRRPSLQKGVQAILDDADSAKPNLPRIKSFVKQTDGQWLLETESLQPEGVDGDEETPENSLKTRIISCESNFYWGWEILIFCFTVYLSVTLPLQISFLTMEKASWVFFCVMAPPVDVANLLDVWLKMRVTYHNYVREEIWNRALIKRRYLSSYLFKIDVLAALPWCSLVTFLTPFQSPFGVLAFVRVFKVIGYGYWSKMKAILSRSTHQNPAIMRMVGIILIFSLVAHLIACMFAYNLNKNNFGGRWYLDELAMARRQKESFTAQYFEAFYFSLAVIAGNDRVPLYLAENLFGCMCLMISFVVNAVVIGSVTDVLSHLDTTAVAQKEQLDSVAEYLRYRRVPLKVFNKILSYYSYLWEIGQSSHSEKLFQELPDKLKLELTVTLNKKLIQSVPLFKACSPAGVIMLVKRLKPNIMLPFELIIKENERADSMFFLNRGTVRCYTHDDTGQQIILTTLRDGAFFGEVALLEMGLKRTANVKAYSFCELQTLMSLDFQAVLNAFPDFQSAVHKIAKARQDMSKRLLRNNSGSFEQESISGDVKQRLKKIVNANMFIHHAHRIVEEDEEEEGDDLYQAILENQRQMTRMAAEDAMQKEQINENDFIQFERAVNSKYDKQVEHYQKKRETTVTLSASALIDLKQMTTEKRNIVASPILEKAVENEGHAIKGNIMTENKTNALSSVEESVVREGNAIKLTNATPESDTSTENSTGRSCEIELKRIDSIGAELDEMLKEVEYPDRTKASPDKSR